MKNKTITKVITLLLLILGGSGLCLADNKAEASDWYSPDWGNRKAITVDNTSNASALTDYQVLVTLNAGDSVYANARSDGSDLRFTNSDELTEISYWIEDWNTSGDSKIWVKVPFVPASSTATIYLYYGNSSATTSLSSFDDTMQKLGTDDDTVGLWHFDEGEGSDVTDSSVNENDGTMLRYESVKGENVTVTPRTDSWTSDSPFSTGSALNFDPAADDYSGDFVEILHDDSLNLGTSNFTFEGWMKTSAIGPYDLTIMDKESDESTGSIGLYLNKRPNYSLHFEVDGSEGGGIRISGDDELSVNDGVWHYFTALREGTKIKVYVDGEFRKEADDSMLSNVSNGASLTFGQYFQESFFIGQFDEFRLSKRALTDGEIKANYEKRQYTEIEPTNGLGAEETTPYDASETVVATAGGTVANTADTVEVTIPADALSSDTEITIETGEDLDEGIEGSFQVEGVGLVDYIYTFGPEGTEFSSPVTIILDYNDAGMTTEEENSLDVYYYNTVTFLWEAQGAIVDTTLNTLTISVNHFCKFAMGGSEASNDITDLLFVIDSYSDAEKIRVEVNGEVKTLLPAYFLKVHLRRAQKLIGEGRDDKAKAVLNKFIEKVERFTPHLIDEDASTVIITETNEIILLL